MAAREDTHSDTNRTNLQELLRYLEDAAAKDEAAFAVSGDEQKHRDAADKRRRAWEIRAMLSRGD